MEEVKRCELKLPVEIKRTAPAVNLYRSCVGLGWLAQETTGFILVRVSEV
jgi:hypothetical protein